MEWSYLYVREAWPAVVQFRENLLERKLRPLETNGKVHWVRHDFLYYQIEFHHSTPNILEIIANYLIFYPFAWNIMGSTTALKLYSGKKYPIYKNKAPSASVGAIETMQGVQILFFFNFWKLPPKFIFLLYALNTCSMMSFERKRSQQSTGGIRFVVPMKTDF